MYGKNYMLQHILENILILQIAMAVKTGHDVI
jgi:hypothetical protein